VQPFVVETNMRYVLLISGPGSPRRLPGGCVMALTLKPAWTAATAHTTGFGLDVEPESVTAGLSAVVVVDAPDIDVLMGDLGDLEPGYTVEIRPVGEMA
jgi:hypothetical protein